MGREIKHWTQGQYLAWKGSLTWDQQDANFRALLLAAHEEGGVPQAVALIDDAIYVVE